MLPRKVETWAWTPTNINEKRRRHKKVRLVKGVWLLNIGGQK
jgi:hypothetical protein